MFTLSQIKTANAQVKSGADFPAFVQALKKLGLAHYDLYVHDGHAVYFSANGHNVISGPQYPPMPIAGHSDTALFQQYLKEHQEGQTDYRTFCHQAAASGVKKWTVNVANMTCTYFNQQQLQIISEKIPVA